jgi:RecA-family ATPase
MTDLREVESMLAAIPVSSCSYQEWLDVGMALHHEGLPVTIWDDWSRDDTRYSPGVCERKWRTFGNGSDTVTLGTVHKMARDNGWNPAAGMKTFTWDDWITSDGQPMDTSGWHKEDTAAQMPPPPTETYNAVRDITDYLTALFDPSEKVCYVTTSYKDEDGKWKPHTGVSSRTCKQLLDSIRRHPEDLSDTFGTTNPEAGAWICFNPVDGQGRNNKNITAYRYALVESDDQDIDTQYTLIQDLKLPVKMLVHSGGKSLHAIVRIDAVDYKQYQERVDILYTICKRHGLHVDTQDKNPSRLSRFPGFMRGEKRQYIVDRDMGCSDWVEWHHWIEDEMVEPLAVVNLAEVWEHMPPVKPELIEGVLRQGHKMMLVSSSKAGKSFALIELAVAIAEGRRWLGFRCRQGRVLYVNLEIDEASFLDRVRRVYETMEISEPHRENFDTVHLRGKAEEMRKLVPQIVRTARKGYAAIILDPIYKLGLGDENAAKEVATFCNAMDAIANTGASVIYSHHHSKGSQGAKASMDRASGSGVFARDADALLDMIELNVSDVARDRLRGIYGDKTDKLTAWRMELTLREFSRVEPVDLFFAYPVHDLDEDGIMAEALLAETERALADGREKNNAEKKARSKGIREKLFELVEADEVFGHRRTQAEYAADLGVSERTIRNYLRDMGK